MENRAFSGITATGQQLAERMVRLVPDLLGNRIPATVGKRISAAMDDAERKLARRTALEALCELLSDGEPQSRWALAQRLESALARFGGVPYCRVKAGYRKPSETECHLMTLLETDGPKSAGKLWWELRAFDLPRVADEAG